MICDEELEEIGLVGLTTKAYCEDITEIVRKLNYVATNMECLYLAKPKIRAIPTLPAYVPINGVGDRIVNAIRGIKRTAIVSKYLTLKLLGLHYEEAQIGMIGDTVPEEVVQEYLLKEYHARADAKFKVEYRSYRGKVYLSRYAKELSSRKRAIAWEYSSQLHITLDELSHFQSEDRDFGRHVSSSPASLIADSFDFVKFKNHYSRCEASDDLMSRFKANFQYCIHMLDERHCSISEILESLLYLQFNFLLIGSEYTHSGIRAIDLVDIEILESVLGISIPALSRMNLATVFNSNEREKAELRKILGWLFNRDDGIKQKLSSLINHSNVYYIILNGLTSMLDFVTFGKQSRDARLKLLCTQRMIERLEGSLKRLLLTNFLNDDYILNMWKYLSKRPEKSQMKRYSVMLSDTTTAPNDLYTKSLLNKIHNEKELGSLWLEHRIAEDRAENNFLLELIFGKHVGNVLDEANLIYVAKEMISAYSSLIGVNCVIPVQRKNKSTFRKKLEYRFKTVGGRFISIWQQVRQLLMKSTSNTAGSNEASFVSGSQYCEVTSTRDNFEGEVILNSKPFIGSMENSMMRSVGSKSGPPSVENRIERIGASGQRSVVSSQVTSGNNSVERMGASGQGSVVSSQVMSKSSKVERMGASGQGSVVSSQVTSGNNSVERMGASGQGSVVSNQSVESYDTIEFPSFKAFTPIRDLRQADLVKIIEEASCFVDDEAIQEQIDYDPSWELAMSILVHTFDTDCSGSFDEGEIRLLLACANCGLSEADLLFYFPQIKTSPCSASVLTEFMVSRVKWQVQGNGLYSGFRSNIDAGNSMWKIRNILSQAMQRKRISGISISNGILSATRVMISLHRQLAREEADLAVSLASYSKPSENKDSETDMECLVTRSQLMALRQVELFLRTPFGQLQQGVIQQNDVDVWWNKFVVEKNFSKKGIIFYACLIHSTHNGKNFLVTELPNVIDFLVNRFDFVVKGDISTVTDLVSNAMKNPQQMRLTSVVRATRTLIPLLFFEYESQEVGTDNDSSTVGASGGATLGVRERLGSFLSGWEGGGSSRPRGSSFGFFSPRESQRLEGNSSAKATSYYEEGAQESSGGATLGVRERLGSFLSGWEGGGSSRPRGSSFGFFSPRESQRLEPSPSGRGSFYEEGQLTSGKARGSFTFFNSSEKGQSKNVSFFSPRESMDSPVGVSFSLPSIFSPRNRTNSVGEGASGKYAAVEGRSRLDSMTRNDLLSPSLDSPEKALPSQEFPRKRGWIEALRASFNAPFDKQIHWEEWRQRASQSNLRRGDAYCRMKSLARTQAVQIAFKFPNVSAGMTSYRCYILGVYKVMQSSQRKKNRQAKQKVQYDTHTQILREASLLHLMAYGYSPDNLKYKDVKGVVAHDHPRGNCDYKVLEKEKVVFWGRRNESKNLSTWATCKGWCRFVAYSMYYSYFCKQFSDILCHNADDVIIFANDYLKEIVNGVSNSAYGK